MIALLLAAQLAAAPVPGEAPLAPNARIARTPNLYRLKPGCEDIQRKVRNDAAEQARKLGRLPPADKEYAVMRQVEDCMVAAPIGYHPQLLPGTADQPVKREDAPENRR
jgi:hypothetical protein